MRQNTPDSLRLIPHAIVRCHGCGEEMKIIADPAQIWVGRTYLLFYPCFEAPYICGACRLDPVRLDKARKAMERHFVQCSGGKDPLTVLPVSDEVIREAVA